MLTPHKVIDVAAPTGTPVYASGDGVVSKPAFEKGWGKLLVIEHRRGDRTCWQYWSIDRLSPSL